MAIEDPNDCQFWNEVGNFSKLCTECSEFRTCWGEVDRDNAISLSEQSNTFENE